MKKEMKRKMEKAEQTIVDDQKSIYSDMNEEYFRRVLVKEQPFYRPGMTESEIDAELEYMNNNILNVINGNYSPLWKQQLFK